MKTKGRIVYGVICDPLLGDEWLAFGLREEAEQLANLREALNRATTWGELRKMITADQFEMAVEYCAAECETFEEFCWVADLEPTSEDARRAYEKAPVGRRKPIDSDAFERSQIPCVYYGDWPSNLDSSVDSWMPKKILRKFSKFYASMGGGCGHRFDPKDRGKIARELRRLGYTVTRDDGLVLWAQFDLENMC